MSGFLDVSLETANAFYKWGWRASIVGAVITTIALVFLFVGTRVREREFDLQISRANSAAAAAIHEAANLNVRARELEQEAAKISLRAAELEKEAANARLALAELLERLAWRHLTPEQSSRLADGLRGHPMNIELTWISGDPEAESYATEIMDAINASQSVAGNVTQAIFAGGFFGLRMSTTHSPEARILEAALRNANIPFTFSGVTKELRMSVGTKPHN